MQLLIFHRTPEGMLILVQGEETDDDVQASVIVESDLAVAA